MSVIPAMAASLMRVEIAGGVAQAVPSFFFPYFGSYYRVHSPERTTVNTFQLGIHQSNCKPQCGSGSLGLCEATLGGEGRGRLQWTGPVHPLIAASLQLAFCPKLGVIWWE